MIFHVKTTNSTNETAIKIRVAKYIQIQIIKWSGSLNSSQIDKLIIEDRPLLPNSQIKTAIFKEFKLVAKI